LKAGKVARQPENFLLLHHGKLESSKSGWCAVTRPQSKIGAQPSAMLALDAK